MYNPGAIGIQLMHDEKKLNLDWYLIFIIAGAALFYLPFIPKQFMGDDWLWLSNAKKALSNPAIFFQRPMYGYLRPLNMIVISFMYKVFGLNAYIFGLGNILLHCTNIILLSEVLKKFRVENRVRYLSTFIFAFYYLNSPVITWIATGHDIWVTSLSLFFVLQILRVFDKPTFGGFLLAWALAFSAVLFKESGFVTLGLYFVIAYINKRSPFSRKLLPYTVIWVITFLGYLVYYALTRTYADKQLEFGFGSIVNLWYFTTYIFFPMAKRIAELLPNGLILFSKTIRIALTLSLPIFSYLILRKGPAIIKLFFLWIIMYVSTIAIMKWGIGIFSLYPVETAGRFFYTSDVGASVILAWIFISIYNKINWSIRLNKIIYALLVSLFIAINLGAVYTITRIYAERQTMVDNLINDLSIISPTLTDNDSLTVLVAKKHDPPEIILESEPHMEAIIYMNFNKSVRFRVAEMPGFTNSDLSLAKRVIAWNTTNEHLIIPLAKQ
jgi:hypothetical protein